MILMQVQPSIHNFQVLLNQIDNQRQVQRWSLFLAGYLLEYVKVSASSEINKILDLITNLNSAVKNALITIPQRKIMLKEIIKKKHQTVELFEKKLNQLFEQFVNKNLIDGTSQSNGNEEQLSQKFIQQMMRKQEQQRKQREKSQNQSLLLIKQLQLKQQESYKRRVVEASKAEIKINCPICLEDIVLTDLALLSCQHAFHRQCVFRHFAQNIQARKFPLKCPGCEIECLQSDVVEYLDNEYMRKYEKLTFQNYVNMHNQDMSWCPTAGCQYVFSFDEGQSEFYCPLCHKVYCLKCKVLYHTGVSCKQFNINRVFDKNDEKFIQFVRGAKYKQCPNCKFWVEKNEGCDHMTCRCRYQFCYVCGGKYQACACMGFGNEMLLRPPPIVEIIPRNTQRLIGVRAPRPTQPVGISIYRGSDIKRKEYMD